MDFKWRSRENPGVGSIPGLRSLLDCDALAQKLLLSILSPPCPSWAGPSVEICVRRKQALEVRVKYTTHAPLDLLFDIYCRKIQETTESVSFWLRKRELQEEDSYASLRMGPQEPLKPSRESIRVGSSRFWK